jgi:hypothetical protein
MSRVTKVDTPLDVFGKVKVNLPLCLRKYHATKTYGEVEAEFCVFFTSALDGVSGQLHAPAAFLLVGEPPLLIG